VGALAARLARDELLVARSVLERGEAGRRLASARLRADLHAPGRSEAGDAPEEASEEEGPQPPATLAVHDADCRVRRVICTLGDLLLDVVVRLDGPIADDTDTYGHTRVGAGGQAANVAAWVVELGGGARFLGKRARDPAGRILAEELQARGVELAGPEVEVGTGTVVSIAAPDGTRTMLSDRGVSTELAPDELDPAWLEGCDWLHVPGYSLVRSPLREAALAASGSAPRVSVDLSSTAAIQAFGVDAFRDTVAALRPQVVFANEAEAELVAGIEAPTVVIKRGERGCVVVTADGRLELPSREANVVDTTGAGDAFAAGFLVGGADAALDAAARCVAKMGAMP
jgi:sugar/nucleoside kinase (ribokinase family)